MVYADSSALLPIRSSYGRSYDPHTDVVRTPYDGHTLVIRRSYEGRTDFVQTYDPKGRFPFASAPAIPWMWERTELA